VVALLAKKSNAGEFGWHIVFRNLECARTQVTVADHGCSMCLTFTETATKPDPLPARLPYSGGFGTARSTAYRTPVVLAQPDCLSPDDGVGA
jgi:hypothetical protein